MGVDYYLSADELRKFASLSIPKGDEKLFNFWCDFADQFGPHLIPFLVRPDAIEKVPFAALNIPENLKEKQKQLPGEMWILFCFKDSMRDSAAKGTPLRTDGFPLVLEWRNDRPDSPLLSSAFHTLAEQVRGQLNLSGWGLWPAYARYHDKVDFTDAAIFADSDSSHQIASAYGALLAGLLCASSNKYPTFWSFPTLQWDAVRGRIAGVGGLREKLQVACDFGAAVITVAKEQEGAAISLVRELVDSKHRTEIYGVRQTMNHEWLAEDIAFGAEKRQRFIRRLLLLALLPLVLVLTALGVVYWDVTRDVVKYYRGHELLFGADVGYDPIDRSEVDGRGAYEFIYRGWRRSADGWKRRLQRVTCINADGEMRPFPCASRQEEMTKECAERCVTRHEYLYDEDGVPNQMHEIGVNGEKRGIIKFTRGNKHRFEHMVFDRFGKRMSPENAPKYIECGANGRFKNYIQYVSGGSYYAVDLNDQGSMVQQEFHMPDGSLCADGNGVAVYKFEYLTNGLERGRYFYNEKMSPVLSRNTGTSGYTNIYDGAGNLLRIVKLGLSREPAKGTDGVAIVDRVYDDRNRIIEEWNKDEFGVPVVPIGNASDTACGVIFEYLGDEETVARQVDSSRCAAIRMGISCVRTCKRGNVRKRRFYGTNDCLVASEGNIAGIDEILDEQGRTVRLTTVDTNNLPCTNVYGCATMVKKYDKYGRDKYQAWFDASSNSVPLRIPGYEKFGQCESIIWDYDDILGLSTCDFKMMGSTNGVARVRVTSMPNGDVWKVQNYNSGDQLVQGSGGWAQKEYVYNNDRCCVGIRLLDVQGDLCAERQYGMALTTCQYQRTGNGVKVTIHLFDENQYHVNGPFGFASVVLLYDSYANLEQFDARDKNNNSQFSFEFQYDANGRIRKFNCAKSGNPCTSKLPLCENAIAISFDYDLLGNVAIIHAIGPNGMALNSVPVIGEAKDKLDAVLKFFAAIRSVFRYRNNFLEIPDPEQKLLEQEILRMKQLL